MRKKKILICDDNVAERNKLERYLGKTYEIVLLDNYEYLVDKVEENYPIHLVFLDLGFNGKFVGHTVLPKLHEKFPKLKVIIYSSLLDGKNQTEELSNILREINHSQVAGYASPLDKETRIVIQANQVTGTSEWIKNDQIWILHISDTQFGGQGLPYDSEKLSNKVWDCLKNYKKGKYNNCNPEDDEYFDYPEIAILTGDLTERATPDDFAQVYDFINYLSNSMINENSLFSGLLSHNNVIFLPGNHDINWDISLARSIHRNESGEPELKRENINGKLDYLSNYPWLPYEDFSRSFQQDSWHSNPGYKIFDLSQELHLIFVCINSSLWGVHHQAQDPYVPQSIFNMIRKDLNEKYDPQNLSTRILLVHHTLEPYAEEKNRLKIKETPTPPELISTISQDCGFSLIFTGHIHKRAISTLDTDHENRSLHNIGAGTLRSSDVGKYDHPQFNLIRLFDLSPNSNKFNKMAIFTFSYDGTNYRIDPHSNDGTKDYRIYDIKYVNQE